MTIRLDLVIWEKYKLRRALLLPFALKYEAHIYNVTFDHNHPCHPVVVNKDLFYLRVAPDCCQRMKASIENEHKRFVSHN